MDSAERFARLFRGFTARFGRYDISDAFNSGEKVSGRARTVDEKISLKNYRDHLAGQTGIGVIPLREDNRVNFAAIDIDVYKQEEKKNRNLTHEDVALALSDTPLIVTRSKSGGIHIWLFSRESVCARLATDYLQAQAYILGVSGTEVFPKQTERAASSDVGNWINLPYFGETRKAIIPNKVNGVYEFIEADLEQFLDIAEMASEVVTDDWLIENTRIPSSQRNSTETTKMWFDGPPCLQSLVVGHPERVEVIERKFKRGEITEDQYKKQLAFTKPQLTAGARDHVFLNVAHYLRRRMNEHNQDAALSEEEVAKLEKELIKVHTQWTVVSGDPDKERDLTRLARQAGKGKWGYSCTKEPLKSFCNRKLCMRRKFGVGTVQNDETAITGFTIVMSSERQYFLTVNDKRVHIPDARTLYNQNMFAQEILNQTDRMWRTMQDAKYRDMIDALLADADKIDPPPDSDTFSIGLNALNDFVHDRKIAKGQNDAALHQGRVIWSEDETTAIFRLDQFIAYLRSRGVTWTPNYTGKMLKNDYGVLTRGNTEIGGRQVRPYEVNLQNLRDLVKKHGMKADG
jgi:hypothetical protein